MMADLKKELVKLRVEWAIRAEYFDDQYTSACVQCAGELGNVPERHMDNVEYRILAEPIAQKERNRYEAIGHLPLVRHHNNHLQSDQKSAG